LDGRVLFVVFVVSGVPVVAVAAAAAGPPPRILSRAATDAARLLFADLLRIFMLRSPRSSPLTALDTLDQGSSVAWAAADTGRCCPASSQLLTRRVDSYGRRNNAHKAN